MTPAEQRSIRDWAVAALDGVIAPASIRWSYQDHPENTRPYCTLRTIGESRVTGVPQREIVTVDDVNYQRTRESWEVTVSIQISARMSQSAPALEQGAQALLSDMLHHLYSESVGWPRLTLDGVAVVSVDGPQDISALVGGSEWDTRADATITFGVARLYDEQIDPLEIVTATGEVSDVTIDINTGA